MAEGLFRELVKDRADYRIASAGIAALPGQSPSQHTANIVSERGGSLKDFKSSQLSQELIEEATHIFTMSAHHLAALVDIYPQAEKKTFLVTEFAAEDMLRGADISDPFGGPRREYDDVRWMLDKALPTVLAYIEQTTKSKA
jgi:glycine hydroxymethyltransferase